MPSLNEITSTFDFDKFKTFLIKLLLKRAGINKTNNGQTRAYI